MKWQRAPFVLAAMIAPWTLAQARSPSRDDAVRAAIHPVATSAAMQSWLARVPVTRDFPADFAATLGQQAPLYIVEMTTTPACLPCDDLWAKLGRFSRTYRWQVGTISGQEAMLRENGGAIFDHGSGGIVLLRAA